MVSMILQNDQVLDTSLDSYLLIKPKLAMFGLHTRSGIGFRYQLSNIYLFNSPLTLYIHIPGGQDNTDGQVICKFFTI